MGTRSSSKAGSKGDSKKTLSLSNKLEKKPKIPSLLEMAKADSELADFLKLVSEHSFRLKAIELLQAQISKA